MRLIVKVIPNSSKRSYSFVNKNEMKVKIFSSPEKGKANKELIEYLSEIFSVPKTKIKIVKGEKSRKKEIEILKQ